MFAALVRDRGALVPELTDVRRFVYPWEKTASVELRAGSPDAIDAYESHGRVVGGSRDEMLDALYGAWKQDIEEGKTSLMIAGGSRYRRRAQRPGPGRSDCRRECLERRSHGVWWCDGGHR